MYKVATAHFFGVKEDPSATLKGMEANVSFDPFTISDSQAIVHTCVPLFFAINNINRAMGVPDVYPFVINQGAVEKLGVYSWISFQKQLIRIKASFHILADYKAYHETSC